MDVRLKRWIGLTGLLFVILVVVSGAVMGPMPPNSNASAAQVVAFYSKHKSRVELSAYIVELSVFVAVIFFWYLRDLVATVEANRRLATIGFVGVVIFAVQGGLTASVKWALADAVNHVAPTTMQTLGVLQNDGSTFLGGVGQAVFLIATGIALIRSGVLARWLGWVGVVFGVVALALPFIGPIPAGLWVLIASIVILVRERGGVPSPDVPDRLAQAS
jgi:hypothetical protein